MQRLTEKSEYFSAADVLLDLEQARHKESAGADGMLLAHTQPLHTLIFL